MNLDGFKGKQFLVTGATSGIGAKISEALLKSGANVVMVSRGIANFDEDLKNLIFSEGSIYADNARLVSLDLSKPEGIDNFVRDHISIKLDGVINAAGIASVVPLKSISVEDINRIIQINLITPIVMIRSLMKNKLINKNSSLIFISSINGTTVGSKAHTIYAASKGGINGFVMSLANEVSKQGIRVNAIAPGMLKTNLMEDVKLIVSSENLEAHLADYPLGIGTPKDVAALAMFLLSDQSSWMTGQTIVIDGGYSIN
jgi:NAD(P)-dependent dehydrogenase (short-subunit alcohol dehydrogenase family)